MRFSDTSEDVEILSQMDNGAIQEKLINVRDCAREFIKITSIDYDLLEIDNFDLNVLFYSRGTANEKYVIRLPERRIKCTYERKGYSVIHPESIFILDINIANKIYNSIKVFCIKEYKGKKTELYRYPFPNMLGANAICTGTISRDASDPMLAILNVIECNYTHAHTSNSKIKKTVDFFKAIKKSFPYEILENSGMTLESAIKFN